MGATGARARSGTAGVPEVIDVGGRPEVWAEAIARFANGSGDGDGGPLLVDSRVQPQVTFNTIIEKDVSGSGAHT